MKILNHIFYCLGNTLSLIFESFDGGRDSIERLTQGLLVACQEAPEKSLVVRAIQMKPISFTKNILYLGCFHRQWVKRPEIKR